MEKAVDHGAKARMEKGVDHGATERMEKGVDHGATERMEKGVDHRGTMRAATAAQCNRAKGGIESAEMDEDDMLVLGDPSIMSHKSLSRFGSYDARERARAFSRGGKPTPGCESLRWACNRPAFVIVGSWLFGHAGVTSQSLSVLNVTDLAGVHHLNEKVREWLLGSEVLSVSDLKWIFWDRALDLNVEQDEGDLRSARKAAEKVERRKAKLLTSSPSPRLEGKGVSSACDLAVSGPLELLKSNGIAVGHTVTNHGSISSACGGRVWRTDLGASRAFAKFALRQRDIRRPAVLEKSTLTC